MLLVLLSKHVKVHLHGHIASICLTFKKLTDCFSKVAELLYIPLAVFELHLVLILSSTRPDDFLIQPYSGIIDIIGNR